MQCGTPMDNVHHLKQHTFRTLLNMLDQTLNMIYFLIVRFQEGEVDVLITLSTKHFYTS